jgi:CRP/FNR family cyclic AMP-dependent transcriptional regulator
MSVSAHWPLLDVLSANDRQQVLAHARRRRFARNEVIFHEGDPGQTMHLVAGGHVAIRMHTPLGDIATVRIVRPGEFFGELAVVSRGPRNATAIALDTVVSVALDRDQLDELRTGHEQIDELLLAALVAEIRRLAEQLVEVMYVPAETRLWRRVSDLAIAFGSESEPAAQIPLTQDVLAQLTGCTRSTANRVLRAGEDEGVIHLGRGRIEILDHSALHHRTR